METGKPAFSFRLSLVTIAAIAFLTVADGAPEKSKRTAEPPQTALVIRRPETVRVRNTFRKRFRPAVPKRGEVISAQPAPELYTGLSAGDTPVNNPDAGPATVAGPDESGFAPLFQAVETGAWVSRHPDNRVSMREELTALEDMDYGRFGAMAFQDGRDKRDVRGFVYIPTTWGEQLEPVAVTARMGSINHASGHPQNGDQTLGYLRPAENLAEAVNRYTNIRAEADPPLYLSSERLSDTPFLYICADTAFELTPTERGNFGRYLRNGGFAFLDNGVPEEDYGPAEASLRQMLRDALGSDARLKPIPNDHPLYHCFFDFDAPPLGAELALNLIYYIRSGCLCPGSHGSRNRSPVYQLEGVFIDGKLVAVYSNKGYTLKWREFTNNEPQLKMGVNLVVYALTREGGITSRTMERYADVQ
ncbi:MAG: DUF4159 domain-containing protein [Candidatus Latescibacterota bacterium]